MMWIKPSMFKSRSITQSVYFWQRSEEEKLSATASFTWLPVQLNWIQRCQHKHMYFTAHINRMWPRAETHNLPVSTESRKNIPPPPAVAAAANLQWVVSKVSCLMWGGGGVTGGWMCAGLTCARWKMIASVKVWPTGSAYHTSPLLLSE